MSVHPDKTAWRAIDALGGTYSSEEVSSGFAMGHGLAIAEAMEAVYPADALAAELLDALIDALPFVECAVEDVTYRPNRVVAVIKRMNAAIAKAKGAA